MTDVVPGRAKVPAVEQQFDQFAQIGDPCAARIDAERGEIRRVYPLDEIRQAPHAPACHGIALRRFATGGYVGALWTRLAGCRRW